MKPEELRTLDAEELGGRLKGARRELYELRFRLAVGQLENHRQILKVRKDIARILTVIHQRQLDTAVDEVYAAAPTIAVENPEEPVETAVTEDSAEATPEPVEAVAAPAKKARAPRKKAEPAADEEDS
jgi:large subunit ribosomal protein L29